MVVYKFVELILKDGSKLPARFMWYPSDHELVYYYLIGKVYYKPLPLPDILEFDMFQIDAVD